MGKEARNLEDTVVGRNVGKEPREICLAEAHRSKSAVGLT